MARSHHKPTTRKGGGQPGNKNALRHGFYSKLYKAGDESRLKESTIDDEQEIARLKAYALAALTPLKHLSDIELFAIDRLNSLLITINTIERTKLLARGHGGDIGADILQALRELNPDEEL